MILNEQLADLCDKKLHVSFWSSQGVWQDQKYTCGIIFPDGRLCKGEAVSINGALDNVAVKAAARGGNS